MKCCALIEINMKWEEENCGHDVLPKDNKIDKSTSRLLYRLKWHWVQQKAGNEVTS